MKCVSDLSAQVKCQQLLMSEIVQKRNDILKSDINLERQFVGSIDEIIIEMNSITVYNWPLFLSEEGDPNFDENSFVRRTTLFFSYLIKE